MDKLIFLDTETTGNDVTRDRLCQVSFQVGEKVETEYFKPPLPVSVKSSSITHITNIMLTDKKPFVGSAMAKELEKLLKKGILVAHNAKFDIAILEAEGISVPKFICTLRMARYLDKENKIPEYGLQYLRYYLNLDVEGHAHDAEGDVRVLRVLFERQLAKMKLEIPDEEKAIEKMVEISKTPTLFNKFTFGKYKEEIIDEILKEDRRYIEWLLKAKLESGENDEDWIYTLQHYLKK